METSAIQQLIERSSSILSLCRTIGWIHRFASRCHPLKQPVQPQNPLTKTSDPLSVVEISFGRLTAILTAQHACFEEEI